MLSTATVRAWISCSCLDARRRYPPRVPPVHPLTNDANREEGEPAPRGLLELNPEAPLQAQWAGSMRNASSRFFCRQPRPRLCTCRDLLGEQRNRLELLAAGERNACFQPVSRSRHEARRHKLVLASPDQLHLLWGTLGSDNRQCSRDVLGRKRLPIFVVDVHADRSLLHDEFDHNRVVPPAHDSSVLRRMIAVCVGVPENEQIENRRDYHGEHFHLFPLMPIIGCLSSTCRRSAP